MRAPNGYMPNVSLPAHMPVVESFPAPPRGGAVSVNAQNSDDLSKSPDFQGFRGALGYEMYRQAGYEMETSD